MILLDTDTLSLLLRGNALVAARMQARSDEVGTTIITRIELLRTRFDFVLKAADEQLLRAQEWVDRTERDLLGFPVAKINAAAADEFEKLRQQKRLKKIGRADLLIASIALAQKALLVTRNLKHFQQVPGLRIENWAD